jgi:hypothetical protein
VAPLSKTHSVEGEGAHVCANVGGAGGSTVRGDTLWGDAVGGTVHGRRGRRGEEPRRGRHQVERHRGRRGWHGEEPHRGWHSRAKRCTKTRRKGRHCLGRRTAA